MALGILVASSRASAAFAGWPVSPSPSLSRRTTFRTQPWRSKAQLGGVSDSSPLNFGSDYDASPLSFDGSNLGFESTPLNLDSGLSNFDGGAVNFESGSLTMPLPELAVDPLPELAIDPLELPIPVSPAIPQPVFVPVPEFEATTICPIPVENPPEEAARCPGLRELATFCLPSLGIWISSPLLSLIDSATVSRFSSVVHLAALGPSTKACDYLAFLCSVLGVATTNLVADALAKKDHTQAKQVVSGSLYVSVFVGVALAVGMGVASGPLMASMLAGGGSAAVLQSATAYTSIRALGYPAALLTLVLQAAFVANKDSLTPLLAVPLTALVNLIGDAFLVGTLGMGAAGAAWATVGSMYVNAATLLVQWRRKKDTLPGEGKLIQAPRKKHMKALLGFAAPMLVATLARVYMGLSITLSAVSLGTTALAANQIVEGLYWLFCPFGEALSLCAQTYLPSLLRNGEKTARQFRRKLLRSAVGVAVLASGTALLLLLSGVFASSAAVTASMVAAAPALASVILLYVISIPLEGMLIARKKLGFLAATHVFNSLLLSFGLLSLRNVKGAALKHVWGLLSLCNAVRFAEFFIALRGAEAGAADAAERAPKIKQLDLPHKRFILHFPGKLNKVSDGLRA